MYSREQVEAMLRRHVESGAPRSRVDGRMLGLSRDAAPVVPLIEPHYGRAFRGFGGESRKMMHAATYRSILVAEFRALLDADPRVVRFASYPHVLTYSTLTEKGKWVRRSYTPDVVMEVTHPRRMGITTIVVEVRADELRRAPSWTTRQLFIEHAYKMDHGVDFRVYGESEIEKEPRLSNCRRLLGLRWLHGKDAFALRRARDVLSETRMDAITVIDLVKAMNLPPPNGDMRAFTCIANMILRGYLHIDNRAPFDEHTHLHRSAV